MKNKNIVLKRIIFRPTNEINNKINETMKTGNWTTKSALIVHALSIGLNKLEMEK